MRKKKKLNKNQKAAKKLINKIMDENPAVGLLVAQCVLNNLADLHRNVYKGKIEEGEGNDASTGQWAYDLSRLETALDIIEDIELG